MGVQFDEAVEALQGGDLDRALSLAQSELSITRSPQAHHLVGLVKCRLGDVDSGLEHFRIAADAEPENVAFRIMLMRALVDAGESREILEMPKPPPIRSAADVELWKARGEAALSAQEWKEAEEAWRTVGAAVRNDWRAWANFGSALVGQHRWGEAIEIFTRAIALNPSEAALYWSLGAALASSDRHEEAIAAFEKFEQMSNRSSTSALALGRSLLALMRFEEAEQAFYDSVALDPLNSDAVHELGSLLERTNRVEALGSLLEQASAAGIAEDRLAQLRAHLAFRNGRIEEAYGLLESVDPAHDPVATLRLRSKIADRLGFASEAFSAAQQMNLLTPDFATWQSRGESYRERIRELGRRLSSMATPPGIDLQDRRSPAFLTGFPRSGTTLLDTFLMGHPDTCVLEEVHLLGAAERQIGRVADLPNASRQVLVRARNAYFAEMDLHIPTGFSGLVVDKLPLNLLGAPFIEAMFPGARIIFAERHPCDAVLSGFMQSFVMNDAMASFLTIEDAADLYDAVMSAWRGIRERFDIAVHTVRYERLVQDAEAELRPLMNFLGLPWTDEVLAHTETAKARGAIITPSYNQVTEPLTVRSVARWRRYEKELEPVLPVLLPWAKWLGYED